MARCPAPADIERVYWSTVGRDPVASDVELHAHISACSACAAQCEEIAALAALGQRLEPSAWGRKEEIRTTLLSSSKPTTDRTRRMQRRWIVPALLAAAAAAVAVWRWPTPESTPASTTASRAAILDHGSTRHLIVSPAPDEIVRLASCKFDGIATDRGELSTRL